MSPDRIRAPNDELPDDPEDLLPEYNILDLDEYLAMYAAVGHPTRYEIVHRLLYGEERTPKELAAAINVGESTLHYHLKKLDNVGLVEKHQRTERGQAGFSTYYLPTVYGELTLTAGVNELIRSEQEFETMYSSSDEK
ncbi:ArsR/SmtB family transcription factor [Natrialbaceae archaeon A-CW1-1]